jgi:hypothetical protein
MSADAYHAIQRQFVLRFPEFGGRPLQTPEVAYARIEQIEALLGELKGLKATIAKEVDRIHDREHKGEIPSL